MNYKMFLSLLITTSFFLTVSFHLVKSQTTQPFYNITYGDGNGIRFWENDAYKLHMGQGSEYFFGPVSDYSIKFNMSGGTPHRGWTWGVAGATPVAAINTLGQMQIANSFTANTEINLPQSGAYGDGWGKWMKFGSGSYAGFPFNLNKSNSGTAVAWDSDGVFFGLIDEGSNRKDAAIAWGDDLDDNLRFIFNSNELMRVSPYGNVGIGTTAIDAINQVKLRVYEPGSSQSTWRGRIVSSGQSTAVVMGEYDGMACVAAHNPALNGRADLYLQHDGGKVAIGTRDVPGNHKFYVNGSAIMTEVNVKLKSAWADYVFDEDYKLPPLSEVEAYIKANKHLPEVPTEKDVKENGINIGEMNALLLKKVEELTLYLIEQQKLNEAQSKEIAELKSLIKNQKK